MKKTFQNHLRIINKRYIFSAFKQNKSKSNNIDLYLLKDANKHLETSVVMAINEYDEAIKSYSDPNHASEAYSKKAFAYFHIKDYDQAIKDVEKSIELNPRNIDAYVAGGSISVALENYKQAIEYLQIAYDLTSPYDFRRDSIKEVINGVNVQTKIDKTIDNDSNSSSNILNKIKNNDIENEKIEKFENIDKKTVEDASKYIDMPFDDSKFMDLQKDLTEKMVDQGGEVFKQKLMKLNEIEAVKKFQQKALKGQKPTYNDYMELMKDKKFQKYNEAMTKIAQNPKFAHVTQKFALQDWNGAYNEIKNDPEALKLYMAAFDVIDEVEDDKKQ